MATGNITRLEGVWPETHERAVRDSAGVNLETKLGNINSNISQLNQKVTAFTGGTDNLIQLQDNTFTVNSVSVKTSPTGQIKITGTASSAGGRTIKLCTPFSLPAGNYRMVLSPLPAPDVFVENASGNAILAQKSTSAFNFTLAAATNVYIGINTVNGTTYSDDFGIAIFADQTKTQYAPTVTAIDFPARERLNGLSQDLDLVDQELDSQDFEKTIATGATEELYISYTNGVAQTSSSNRATGYINVSFYRGKVITYLQNAYTVASGQVGMAFYNDNKTFVSGVPCHFGAAAEGTEETTTVVPDNATYARFSIFATSASQFYVKNLATDSKRFRDIEAVVKTTAIEKSYTTSGAGHYKTTTPIHVFPGEKVRIVSYSANSHILIECDSEGRYVKSLIHAGVAKDTPYEYYFKRETYVIVVYSDIAAWSVDFYKVGLDEIDKYNQFFDDREFGINCRAIHAIANKDAYVYKDALVTGVRPRAQYDILVSAGGKLVNYSKKAFRIKSAAGSFSSTVTVRDKRLNVITSKNISIEVRQSPSQKLSNRDNLNVLFMGDSIIGGSGNRMGGEFRRMLATNDSETHINPDGTILLPTLNVCPDKITLIGEYGSEPNHYQVIQTIEQIMTGKRQSATGQASPEENPFYNPTSSEPDEVGTDGFNKRVDFAWYFNKVMGAGEYPGLIYICLGANDTTGTGPYDFSLIGSVTSNLVAVIKKMKAACDAIAGGDSGVRFKVLNHQMYPLDYQTPNSYDIHKQNIRRQLLSDSFHFSINYTPVGIKDYTDFLDTACRFDWELGYTPENVSTNARIGGEHDVTSISDCFHMSPLGHYNYADVLIDDFLFDEHFD